MNEWFDVLSCDELSVWLGFLNRIYIFFNITFLFLTFFLYFMLIFLFSPPLCPFLIWIPAVTRHPTWPTSHVAMENQSPGDGHMAAKFKLPQRPSRLLPKLKSHVSIHWTQPFLRLRLFELYILTKYSHTWNLMKYAWLKYIRVYGENASIMLQSNASSRSILFSQNRNERTWRTNIKLRPTVNP